VAKSTEALAVVEANWRQDTRNLFALHQVVRLRLWSGGRESAFELGDALRDTQPTRAEDAYGKMFGLLLLAAHDETIEAWHTLRDADIWDEGSAVESLMRAHFARVAEVRKGEIDGARKFFSEALDHCPRNRDMAARKGDVASAGNCVSPSRCVRNTTSANGGRCSWPNAKSPWRRRIWQRCTIWMWR
jgi:hypothetical protein